MKFGRFVAFLAAVGLMISCTSFLSAPQTPQPKSYGSELHASHGESEIILHGTPNVGTLNVYLNGALKQTMLPQDSIKMIVPDGQHTILVNWIGKDENGRNLPIDGEPQKINIESMQYVYSIQLPKLLGGSSAIMIGRKVRLEQVSSSALSGLRATGASKGIEGAVIRISERLIPELPRGAAIAVLSISASDGETSANAIDELEFQLVKSRLFTLVDRKQLDLIRSERDLHLSGEVSDESAVSIGKMVGAGVVITGSITGAGAAQRLTLKALNVETGVVAAMEREAF